MPIIRKGRFAAGVGVCLVGAALGFLVFRTTVRPSEPRPEPTASVSTAANSGSSWDGGLAMRYAKAVQKGDCDEILRSTAWMVDRMRRVAIESPDSSQIESAKETICSQIRNRSPEGNVLRVEGIEDQYVFAPGTQLEVASIDEGRGDLGAPVECRVWIRVTYPRPETAPLVQAEEGSSAMRPIRSWNAGVNISRTDSTVLKAAVTGNLEIDLNSLSFDWPKTR